MTPKEKAFDLCEKLKDICDAIHYPPTSASFELESVAKQCASLAVDEILSACPGIDIVTHNGHIFDRGYWILVKEEINNL